MSYMDGFVVAVPAANKDAYRDMAARAWEVFRDHGALRLVECWGDDVPDGKVTDFRGAVKAQDGEAVVFSWIEWPSREIRDKAHPKIMDDPRMRPDQVLKAMPFDGRRMIHGGFAPILDVCADRS